jgi:hypothetical protein
MAFSGDRDDYGVRGQFFVRALDQRRRKGRGLRRFEGYPMGMVKLVDEHDTMVIVKQIYDAKTHI